MTCKRGRYESRPNVHLNDAQTAYHGRGEERASWKYCGHDREFNLS